MEIAEMVTPALNGLSTHEIGCGEAILKREKIALAVHRSLDALEIAPEKVVGIVRAVLLTKLYPGHQARTPQWHRDLFEKVRNWEEQKDDPDVQRALDELIHASKREFSIKNGGARPVKNAHLHTVIESEFGFGHNFSIPSVRAEYSFEKAELGDAFAYVNQYGDSYDLRGHVHMGFVLGKMPEGLLVRRMRIGSYGDKWAILNGRNRYFLGDNSDADGKESIEELDWASSGILYHIPRDRETHQIAAPKSPYR